MSKTGQGDVNKVKALINARLDGVVFVNIGDAITEVKSAVEYGMRTQFVVYAALIDRYSTTQTLAIAMCSTKPSPATTIDRLEWRQLHIRTYTDEELHDLTSQLNLQWNKLGVSQNLPIDPYGDLDDVRIYQDTKEANNRSVRSTRTYRSEDKSVSLTFQAARPDGLGGNDLPSETTFVPALELFDTVIWI